MDLLLDNITESLNPQATQSAKLAVDRDAGVIRGLKIMGLVRKGPDGKPRRIYEETALAEAVATGKFEDVICNYTPHHESSKKVGVKDSRPVTETLGKFKNVKFVKGSGVFGDLHYLKTVKFTETLCEACERMPDLWGFSPVMDGETTLKGNVQHVMKIEVVKCVDLVRDPATTQSLAESQDSEQEAVCESCGKAKSILESQDCDDSGKLGKLREVYGMSESMNPPVSPAKDSMNAKAPKDSMKESLAESAQPQPSILDQEIANAARFKKLKALAESLDVDIADVGDELIKLDDAAAIKLLKRMALSESSGARTPVPAPEGKPQEKKPEPMSYDQFKKALGG